MSLNEGANSRSFSEGDNSSRFNGDNNSTSFNRQLGLSEKPKGWISRRLSPRWEELWEEAKQQCRLAGPLITVNLFQWAFQLIAIMFVGHLGELQLSSSSIATFVANVTSLCVMALQQPFMWHCVGS